MSDYLLPCTLHMTLLQFWLFCGFLLQDEQYIADNMIAGPTGHPQRSRSDCGKGPGMAGKQLLRRGDNMRRRMRHRKPSHSSCFEGASWQKPPKKLQRNSAPEAWSCKKLSPVPSSSALLMLPISLIQLALSACAGAVNLCAFHWLCLLQYQSFLGHKICSAALSTEIP